MLPGGAKAPEGLKPLQNWYDLLHTSFQNLPPVSYAAPHVRRVDKGVGCEKGSGSIVRRGVGLHLKVHRTEGWIGG